MTLRAEQVTISQRLLKRIREIWPLFDPERIDETWPLVLGPVGEAVAEEHTAASDVAISEYLAARAVAGVAGIFVPRPAALAVAAVRTSLTVTGPVAMKIALRAGATPRRASKLALVQFQGAATRHALAGVRQTTLQAVSEDAEVRGWARLPKADACPFCLLLATRGGVYKSKATALTEQSGQSYHDHCGCVAQPIFTENWNAPAHVRRAEELYVQSTAGLTGKEARDAFAAAVTADRQPAPGAPVSRRDAA